MSRIEELIREKCPDGVEYKTVRVVIKSLKTGLNPRKNFVLNAEGADLYYVTGKDITNNSINISDKTDLISQDIVNLINRRANIEVNDVLFVSTGTGTVGRMSVVSEYNNDWAVSETIFCLKPQIHLVISNYLMYALYARETILQYEPKISKGSVPHLKVNDLLDVEIPVPPIEVQKEIVRILDKFTELEAGLQAELDARKKQYEYYRDKLLTFGDNVTIYKMGDVLTFLNGRAYKQDELLNEGKYPVLRVGNFYTNDSWYYSNLELEVNKYCEEGDLLYSWAATLGPKIWNGDKCIYHYHIWKILFDETFIDKEYLYYYLQYDLSNIARSTTNSTMIHISMGSMMERIIGIPSIERQRKIASILNKFEIICNDTKQGLLKEIEIRRKQYEYYRDLLLTFERVGR